MEAKTTPILGIHHVTAMSGDPQRNVDFYTGVLGLRLVKLTVNYDDPGTYHLYYGDGAGSPGTILTFFPWPDSPPGQNGAGMVTEIAFAVPVTALEFWKKRLNLTSANENRFGEGVITFSDPDGLQLAVIGSASAAAVQSWSGSPIAPENALRGIHSITLTESQAHTAEYLTSGMGFLKVGDEGNRTRFSVSKPTTGGIVDVVQEPRSKRGRISAGTVHHLAWRVPDDETQVTWQKQLTQEGAHVSPVMDRTYFHSIYWREPGGVLFEIATDAPGFTIDEPWETLGEQLILPRWLEPMRNDLQNRLPKIERTMNETFVHRFVKGSTPDTLLLLHGTGDDENGLIELGRQLAPNANLLSPRGKVLENGMPRFFRRLRPGVFDQEDLRFRTKELAAFVRSAAKEHNFDPTRVIAVGYSNGANIAASLLYREPELLAGALLFRPMNPWPGKDAAPRATISVLIAAGKLDTMSSVEDVEGLATSLKKAGAQVEIHWHPGGHELGQDDLSAAEAWTKNVLSLIRSPATV